jgi:hypothetical protein
VSSCERCGADTGPISAAFKLFAQHRERPDRWRGRKESNPLWRGVGSRRSAGELHPRSFIVIGTDGVNRTLADGAPHTPALPLSYIGMIGRSRRGRTDLALLMREGPSLPRRCAGSGRRIRTFCFPASKAGGRTNQLTRNDMVPATGVQPVTFGFERAAPLAPGEAGLGADGRTRTDIDGLEDRSSALELRPRDWRPRQDSNLHRAA